MIEFISVLLFLIFFLISITEAFCFPCEYPGMFRLVNSMTFVSAIAAVYFVIIGEQKKTVVEFQKLLSEDDDHMIDIELA